MKKTSSSGFTIKIRTSSKERNTRIWLDSNKNVLFLAANFKIPYFFPKFV